MKSRWLAAAVAVVVIGGGGVPTEIRADDVISTEGLVAHKIERLAGRYVSAIVTATKEARESDCVCQVAAKDGSLDAFYLSDKQVKRLRRWVARSDSAGELQRGLQFIVEEPLGRAGSEREALGVLLQRFIELKWTAAATAAGGCGD